MLSGVSIFGLLPLFIGVVIPLLVAGFVVYFLIQVIQFMKSKTEHNALLLEKLDALLAVQKENPDSNSQHIP